MPTLPITSQPVRFTGDPQHRHFQVRMNYDTSDGKPALEVHENVRAHVPTKATSIVWLGSSLQVGKMFFRRSIRNYLIPTLHFILKRRII